jgi:hypothetical protein
MRYQEAEPNEIENTKAQKYERGGSTMIMAAPSSSAWTTVVLLSLAAVLLTVSSTQNSTSCTYIRAFWYVYTGPADLIPLEIKVFKVEESSVHK